MKFFSLSGPLRKHALYLAFSLLVAALVGLLLGQVWLLVALTALAHLVWQLRQLYRLHDWLSDGRGPPPHAVGLWDDVYARLHRVKKQSRRRKKRLARIWRQLRQATSALPDGIVLLDENFHVNWANQSAEQLIGIVRAQDANRPVTNILRDARVVRWLSEAHEKRQELLIESTRQSGRQLLLRLFAYGDGELLLIARDVTDILRAETMRRDFVANVSHELRTPLTVISGYVETMVDEASDEWRPVAQKVEQQAQRMRAIVDDLLTLSRLDSRHSSNADLLVPMQPLVDSVLVEARALSQGRHEFETEVTAGLNLMGSMADLHSALLNLVGNAVRYTPAGGRIQIRWYGEGGGAVFAVIDNGPGISAQHVPRLTERFYRVSVDRSRDSGGTGLGLAIVKHVLAMHDASLQIDSTPGEGSTFRCHFPPHRVAGQWAVEQAG